MLTAARYASRLIESRGDITKRAFSSILQNVSRTFSQCDDYLMEFSHSMGLVG